ncbi:hypothetical protein K1T71_011652 [Dendrolimus kikuchii]|uniref:Uncharacterized protein n=1 Tax=Dendrolimus kikuchii TaxID=765133 RepID=A0ACC1CLV7_9NEOP|nr:hypothetical protein K1T71_011652 [Dendrolimus kikuchii]
MFKYLGLLLLTIGVPALRAEDPTAGTELMMTFLIHRHGDRTPVETSLTYSTDSDALDALSAPYGYGQLTDEGKRTAYKLGKFIRGRYDELLSEKYNKSEIYIRSTDSTRTKMTALAAMSAVYPAGGDNWSDEINWTPIPYTTVPVKYDFNMAMFNCPTFTSFYYTSFMSSPSSMEKFSDTLATWSNYVSVNLTDYPMLAYAVYDVYTAQINLGLPLGEELESIWSDIEDTAGGAVDVAFGDDDYKKYQAGVLLNEFFNVIEKFMNGEDTQRVQIYSAHDVNVYAFMAITEIFPRQGVPKYGSAFALELRKVTETGDYVILPVYLKDPKTEEVVYLQVEGCDDLLCSYDTFKEITSGNAMDEDTWRSGCGFTDDLVIDTTTVN